MPASATWRHFSEARQAAHGGAWRGAHLNATIFRQVACKSEKKSPLAPKQISRAANTPYYIIVAYGTFTYVLTALLTEQRFGPKCFVFTDA